MLEGIRTRLRGGAAPDAALTTAERYLLILFAVVTSFLVYSSARHC